MKYAFGVDVGGTTVKLGLFSADGKLLEKWEIPTRTEQNGRLILPDISASIRGKLMHTNALTVPTGAANTWSAVLIFLLPAGMLTAGIAVFVRRKRK